MELSDRGIEICNAESAANSGDYREAMVNARFTSASQFLRCCFHWIGKDVDSIEADLLSQLNSPDRINGSSEPRRIDKPKFHGVASSPDFRKQPNRITKEFVDITKFW